MKEDEFTHRKMELILRECPHYDFFLEPYLECMKALEHRVFLCGDSQSWLVDTYTSTPGVVTSNLMKKDSVTNMLEVDDLKVLVYSISTLKYMIIERVARKVKEILLHGRGLLFNSAERLMLRVDSN